MSGPGPGGAEGRRAGARLLLAADDADVDVGAHGRGAKVRGGDEERRGAAEGVEHKAAWGAHSARLEL
jgi:hypothetical protein